MFCKTITSNAKTSTVVGAVIVTALSISGATAAQDDAAAALSASLQRQAAIEGVWNSNVTLKTCDLGIEVGTLRATNLFARDGSIVATSTVARDPSLGQWRRVGERKFVAKSRFFRYGPGGIFEGVQQVTRRITMARNGKSFTGEVLVEMFDLSDTLFRTSCGTEAATRVY